jgi:hypothetical protein
MTDKVKYEYINHPAHYNPGDYEAYKVIRAYNLNFARGNAIKYILRAGKKPHQTQVQDLKKALWYIQSEIDALDPHNQL